MALPPRDREAREGRFAALAGLVFVGFALVVVGLLRLQVVQHDELAELAKENRVRLEVVRAPRGSIFDRNGALLADTTPSFNIVFRPFPAESSRLARLTLEPVYVARVAHAVRMDTSEVRGIIETAHRTGKNGTFVRAAPFAILAAVEETRAELPGLEVAIEPLRRYPNGAMAAHLLGYAGEINDVELDSLGASGYRSGDLIGRTGVERSYEDMLHGRDGAEFVVVNARGKRVAMLEGEPPRAPEPGHDLVLTVDLKVQRAMEEAMAGVDRGAGVALDPRDGSVLALVSRPSFDPNEFSRGITFARWRALTSGGRNPLLDRAIQGVYPPGSTFKVVSMVASLRAGIARPHTTQSPCWGSITFGGRRFGCWKHEGHGTLDLIGALQHSCDVYFYQLGPRLGLPRLEAAAREFGLGDRTGVDLPQERKGLIPSPAWYDQRWGPGNWRKGLMLNLIIGQGELLLTPIQLSLVAAQAGNSGHAIRPHVVREIRGVGIQRPDRPRQPGPALSPDLWSAVHEAMEKVVDNGTATLARVPGLRVAGKTGTAQNPHGKDHALFICYAPADKPEIAMAFVIENSGHGGTFAAPIAAKVLSRLYLPDSLQNDRLPRPLRVAPPDTTGGPGGD